MNTKDSGIVESFNQAFTDRPPPNNNERKEDEKKDGGPEWNQFESPGTAFLGPQLWEKSVACETDLKLEYMDLDEFLNEKNIDDELLKRTLAALPHTLQHPLTQGENSSETTTDLTQLVSTLTAENSYQNLSPGSSKTGCSSPINRLTLDYTNSSPKSDPKSPLSPSSSLSDYKEDFDRRGHPFSEDELKPSPMSKKSQKRYVPHEMKDDRYWARRRKNNVAAKRSRDARRMKENQIALRAIFLEKENNNLRNELDKTRSILEMMKKKLEAYEPSQ